MVVHKRVGIILVLSVAFIVSTITIGIFLGIPFNQTVTVLTLVGLAITFSIGAEQILRWTETDHAGNSTMTDSTSGIERTQSVTEGDSSGKDTTSSPQDSLYASFRRAKEWKEYPDQGYEFERILSKFANFAGGVFCRVPGVTPRRLWTIIAFVMFLGLAGNIVAISELLVQIGFTHKIANSISDTFSIKIIESNTFVSIVVLGLVTLLPFYYLTNKGDMSCSDCGADFSLQSLGRFYDQKERVPVTDEDGNETGHYYEYDGYRIIECQECGETI